MIRVRALGQNVIEVKRRAIRPDAELLFATLLYLATERGRRVERETIASMFWPRETAARRRHSLRQILYKLRRVGVDTGDAADALTINASEVWLDFEDADGSDDRKTQRELAGAGGVRCLPGYAPKFSKAFADWLDEFRARAESAARRRIVAAIGTARRAGRWEEVEPLARNCLQLDPLNEEATLALAEAIALAGAKSKAVAMLDAYVAELGPNAGDMKLPANVLRRRIADQIGPRRLKGPLETKLIGREDIMGEMTAALEKTKAGNASTHVLWGVSGIGKTRVLEEVTKLAGLMGVTTVYQRAAPDDEHTPGLTLVRLARSLLAAPGSLGLAPDVLALLRRVTAQVPSSIAAHQVDVSEDALVRAVVDLERSLAWERPVLIVLDDLHLADEMTRRVLSRAHGCLTTERALLLMASVPEPPSNGLGRLTAHALRRLQGEACVHLARAFFERAGHQSDENKIVALATASGGHPLVLREAVISNVQSAGSASAASFEGVLQRRHAALSERARDVLLSSLLLAEHAHLALLVECSDLEIGAVEAALSELEEEQIVECSPSGNLTIHSVWQTSVDVLYPSSKLNVRRLRIAHALELASQTGGLSAERLLASASVFQRAGDAQRAARALAKGGFALRDRALAPAAYSAFKKAADLDPNWDDFERCLMQSLIAAQQADLFEEAASIVDRFGDRLRTSQRLSGAERTELDVIAVEVQSAQLSYIDESKACVSLLRRNELSRAQTLRVALAGVRWADHSHDPDTVHRIIELTEASPVRLESEGPIGRQIAMVAAISSRRILAARELAEADLAEIDAADFSRERIRMLLNNRIPFYFDCDFSRIEQILNSVRERLTGYASTFLALRADDLYATHCIDMMRLTEAREIIDRATERTAQFGYKGLLRSFREIRDRLAVADPDDRRGVRTDDDSEWPSAPEAIARLRVVPLCNRAIIAARQGDRETLVELVPQLAKYWSLVQRGCPFDYPCVALAISLTTVGRRNAATALVEEYLGGGRVTNNPPSPFTLALASEFDVRFS